MQCGHWRGRRPLTRCRLPALRSLDACERAVALAPEDGSVRDSRGVARALTGDMAGVIADFEFAVKWTKEGNERADFIASREAWIAALKTGKNPFDVETLLKLRGG